jgi:hypothetical protein
LLNKPDDGDVCSLSLWERAGVRVYTESGAAAGDANPRCRCGWRVVRIYTLTLTLSHRESEPEISFQ